MSRAGRLLDLLQLLRRHRTPVTGAAIAAELGISLRTLYRDIATLQAQGIHLDGAPGLGYVLRPGAVLPPLMFSVDEVEALALGLRWVVARGDAHLAAAAREALAKIGAVVPSGLRHELDSSALLIGPSDATAAGGADLATIQQAIRDEHKLDISYCNAASQAPVCAWIADSVGCHAGAIHMMTGPSRSAEERDTCEMSLEVIAPSARDN